ncbi:hypothetical protein llap_15837 [Limosa lapponica baueri]|uniref:Uncharacterized protein n=1 Tax=Limosa lapponica baueri TaxID=1758121 RepID=A0A2I0TJ81_LIMLA|nr:hypothetical protein llap_15837 [Limosa lapponica baueri]
MGTESWKLSQVCLTRQPQTDPSVQSSWKGRRWRYSEESGGGDDIWLQTFGFTLRKTLNESRQRNVILSSALTLCLPRSYELAVLGRVVIKVNDEPGKK